MFLSKYSFRSITVVPTVKTHIISFSIVQKYTDIKYTQLHNLSWLHNDCVIDLTLLTYGNPNLSNEQNDPFLE